MRPVQGVSYPRSGHGAVLRLVRDYFGDALIYCDANHPEVCGCQSVPCTNPERTFAKNHDFAVHNSAGTPVIPSERYIIQYRSPVRSIVSNFYLFRKQGLRRRRKSEWRAFALRSVEYWNRFVDKWVIDLPAGLEPPLMCSYESLVSDPATRARDILTYIAVEPLDEDAIDRYLAGRRIRPLNRLSKFRYYDAGFFRELEDMTSGRLAKLGLPSFDEGI